MRAAAADAVLSFGAAVATPDANPMTLQELLAALDAHPLPVIAYFLSLPAIAWLTGRFHAHGSVYGSPLRWLYAGVLYGACLPGLVAAIAFADTLAHGRVIQAGLLSQILPLIAMFVTLGLIRQQADPEHIPGFRRMTGFVLLLVFTAISVFLLMQTRIWIFIGGGFGALAVSLGVLFLLLKWAFDRAFGTGR
jgi:predicted Na+-dependent transporter